MPEALLEALQSYERELPNSESHAEDEHTGLPFTVTGPEILTSEEKSVLLAGGCRYQSVLSTPVTFRPHLGAPDGYDGSVWEVKQFTA